MEDLLSRLDWGAGVVWATGHGVRLAIILALAYAAALLSGRLVPRMVDATLRKAEGRDPDELTKRRETLSSVMVKTLDVVIWLVAIFMLLAEIEINIAPVIAGVSVVGIAVGFGAQSLVKDILSGLLILLEDQYRKGDVVKVAGVSGLVEEVNLRRTILRDTDGTVHTVPNGQITVASNLTREWSRVNMNVTVAYSEDLDRVAATINRVGEEMAQDEQYGPLIVEPPKLLRIEAFEESGVVLKILGVTKPMKQWEVAGELRRRLKRTFDEDDIAMPSSVRAARLRDGPNTDKPPEPPGAAPGQR